jgi:hypothetical protein
MEREEESWTQEALEMELMGFVNHTNVGGAKEGTISMAHPSFQLRLLLILGLKCKSPSSFKFIRKHRKRDSVKQKTSKILQPSFVTPEELSLSESWREFQSSTVGPGTKKLLLSDNKFQNNKNILLNIS